MFVFFWDADRLEKKTKKQKKNDGSAYLVEKKINKIIKRRFISSLSRGLSCQFYQTTTTLAPLPIREAVVGRVNSAKTKTKIGFLFPKKRKNPQRRFPTDSRFLPSFYRVILNNNNNNNNNKKPRHGEVRFVYGATGKRSHKKKKTIQFRRLLFVKNTHIRKN